MCAHASILSPFTFNILNLWQGDSWLTSALGHTWRRDLDLMEKVRADRQADRQTGRQADRQTCRQADRQTGRQADP